MTTGMVGPDADYCKTTGDLHCHCLEVRARLRRLERLGKDTVRHLYRNDPMEGSRDSMKIEEWEAVLAEENTDA